MALGNKFPNIRTNCVKPYETKLIIGLCGIKKQHCLPFQKLIGKGKGKATT